MPSKISTLAERALSFCKTNLTSPSYPKAKRPGKRRSQSNGFVNRLIIASIRTTSAPAPPSHNNGPLCEGTATATTASRSHAKVSFNS
jgi:hypothetical protein